MSDKDDKKNLTIREPRPSGGIKAGVTQQLAAIGVPESKHGEKIAEAKVWWFRAGVCAFLTLLFLSGASYVVYLQRENITVLLLIALGVPVGLPMLATLFCASQADGEATKAFLATIAQYLPFVKKPTP